MSSNNLSKDEGSQEVQINEKSSVPAYHETGPSGPQDQDELEWHLDFKIFMAFVVRILASWL